MPADMQNPLHHHSPLGERTDWQEITARRLTGERALFGSRRMKAIDCLFEDGESPLKESCEIELHRCLLKWKYPLWYCRDVLARDCSWFEMARAGVWYSDDVRVENAVIEAPKNFRRCRRLSLKNVHFSNAAETLWHCDGVTMEDVQAKGDYLAMNCSDMDITRLSLVGNYSFDGARRVTLRDSKLLSKDAFWNSEDITVENSFISGEYLGWNARNLTLRNCTIESLQGLCYIDNLVMQNCTLINTTLAFEYSSVQADICSGVESVLNPASGSIRAAHIGELILQRDRIDPSLTTIICRD